MSAADHEPQPKPRQWATILVADAAGYTRMMEQDEDATHRRAMFLMAEIIRPAVQQHGGRVVKYTGDGFLATFPDLDEGVHCAVELQRSLDQVTAADPPERRIRFRMGMNACDVIVEPEDIYGEGVNIAARLQSYAEPGDIVVTQAVAEQARLAPDDPPRFPLGDLVLKNLSRSVRAIGLRVSSGNRPIPAAPVRATDHRPSIAVLPFRKLMTDAADQYMAAGMTEEIIHALGSLRELFVIARASTLAFTGPDVDIREIGRQFGVRYVLTGLVQCIGDRLRICTELSETGTGHVLSVDVVEGARDELFQLQTRAAVLVLKRIAPEIRARELGRIMRQSPDNLTAYDLTLQALDHLYRMDYASHIRARSLLQQAVSDDPNYGPAYTYTAYALIFRVGEGWSVDPAGDTAEAARAANMAIELNRNDALALAIFGHVQAFLLRSFDAARMFLDRALEAGPNCANAWTLSSAMHGYVNEAAAAIAHAEHGYRLSPLDGHVFWHMSLLGQAHYVAGHYDKAVLWAQRAFERNGQGMANLRLLATSLVALGRTEEARVVSRRLLSVQPGFRLSRYAPLCPFQPPLLGPWVERLRAAGCPD